MSDIVDTNVWLSRWPFRRLPHDEPPALAAMLRRHGVVEAWVGSFDGLLHRDLAAVNTRLVNECRETAADLLAPFGTINPRLPDWQEDLRRCHEEHRMPGIRLAPGYHGYRLDEPEFAALLDGAAKRGLLVELVVSLEDQRTQHPLLRAAPVDAAPLVELVRRLPDVRLVLLGAPGVTKPDVMERLAAAEQVYFEIATQEGVGGVAKLIERVTLDRVLFGSASPLFYFDSAKLKLQESELAGEQLNRICNANARRLRES
ncbi:MAG TPA: amidohydrolase family protein [Pirellulales bacterium]|nr:amidohydrolase family protein [Pirellulales bacterium]